MLNAKQIEKIITDAIESDDGNTSPASIAAAKIASLCGDDGAAVAAASIERDVSSALIDLVVATVLATLIEEEGGGRSNIAISPLSMDHTTKHYEIESTLDGMIRKVEIKLRDDSDLRDEEKWREPSNRHGLVDVAEEPYTIDELRPQAEPKTYDRPRWAVRYTDSTGAPWLLDFPTRAEAEYELRARAVEYPLARIENRWCWHLDCPTTGCNANPALRDHSEATSELTDTK